VISGVLASAFERPTTKDFVWSCWFGKSPWCYNFIFFLLTIVIVVFVLMFWFAFRQPKIVPGKYQYLIESGLEFVRQQVVLSMIGPEGLPFLALLATFFFFILLGNTLEITPFVMFPLNSRIAFPIVLAIISWVTYNVVGVRRHGALGYLKLVLFPPGVPMILKPFIALIEFISVILVRPLTLSVRLFANMVAGHFLLAVFFLGSIALFTGIPYILGAVSFAMGIVLIGFELFVAVLQAFIFSVLSASYIAGAMATEH